MTDASSLPRGWADWAEVFEGPKADVEEVKVEDAERADRLGAASSPLDELDAEAGRDAALVPLTFESPRVLPRAGKRGPPALLELVEWRAGLGMVEWRERERA